MKRKFTPPYIGGSSEGTKAIDAHQTGFYQDQEKKRDRHTTQVKNKKAHNKKWLKIYGAADFHNRKGHGTAELERSAHTIEAIK